VSYALKLAGVAIAILLGGIAAIWIFSAIWLRIGLGAALLIVVGGLLLVAWRSDKKEREARAGLERI
jgi:Na+/alanine symporter